MISIFLIFFFTTNQTIAKESCKEIQVDHKKLYEAQTPHVSFSNLKKITLYKITARRGEKYSSGKMIFESSITALSNMNGKIDLTTDAPSTGSYSSADPWGVFWSMKEVKNSSKVYHDEITIYLREENQFCNEQIQKIKIHKGPQKFIEQKISLTSLKGNFFRPVNKQRTPAILILHGSEGMPAIDEAKWYAANGIAALAVHYFDYDPQNKFLPNLIQEIPLERFKVAIDWLKKQKSIDKIIVSGGSRGGELALLLGAEYSTLLSAIIAEKPSSYLWGTRTNGTFSKNLPISPETSSWKKNNTTLPYIKMPALLQTISKTNQNIDGYSVFEYFQAYETALNSASIAEKEAASIPVDKINIPIFVTGFGKDGMWPSKKFLIEIQEKRKKFKDDIYLLIENAGHVGGIPGYPTGPDLKFLFPNGINDYIDNKGNYIMVPEWGITGGDPQENFKAILKVHSGKMEFLKKITGISLQTP